jgi:hypothetical protein
MLGWQSMATHDEPTQSAKWLRPFWNVCPKTFDRIVDVLLP